MKVYRVNSTVNYLPGSIVYEKEKAARGQYWKEGSEIRKSHWDIVIAIDCEEAIRKTRLHHTHPDHAGEIVGVYAINHIGDVTIP